jgi:hypothetical protein
MASCQYCRQEILFSDLIVSPKRCRKIPLDPNEQPHKCSIWAAQHRKYYDCRNNCGGKIYFDDKQKTDTGKWIPIDQETGFPHICLGGN